MWRAVAFPAALTLGLAACGSGSSSATRSSTTSTTTRPASATPIPKCMATQLKGTQSWQGALGTEVGHIELTNTSPETCSMYGYVGFTPISSTGQSLPVNVVHKEGLNCSPPEGFCTPPGEGPPLTVSLSPGQSAFFGFTYPGVPAGGYSCDQGVSTAVTPPGQIQQLDVPGTIDPCGPNYTVTISPIYSGSGPTAAP
jgi:hypothetical protein